MKRPDRNTRNTELGKIHIAKKQLGMDDDTYRDMLWTIARVRSAKDLDHAGRKAVLEHMKRVGFKGNRPDQDYPGRPHNINSADRGPLLKKIEAQLADAGLPWTYAEAMAQRICKVEKITFCDVKQLQKIIAALTYNAKRQKEKVHG